MSFSVEESNIKYEDYYFNGIPIPNNIKFKNIGTNNKKKAQMKILIKFMKKIIQINSLII